MTRFRRNINATPAVPLAAPCWCAAAKASCALRNAIDKVGGDTTPYFLGHGAHVGDQLVPCGAAAEHKPASFEEKIALQTFSLRTFSGIFAGYHSHYVGDWSGDHLVYDEDALRPATVCHYAHLLRNREVILPAGREFKFLAKDDGFLLFLTTKKIIDTTDDPGASSSGAALEQEATPVGSSDGKASWVDCPDVVVHVHKNPRRKMCVPIVDGEDVPSIPRSAIDVSRRTRTNLEKADETEFGDIWYDDDTHTRELSDVWVGQTVFDQLLVPPPGDGYRGDQRESIRHRDRATPGLRSGSE